MEENGRKYHRYKAGAYMLPNDESEQARLDIQHHLFLLGLHGRLFLAPIEDAALHNVLDVATGTGIWATDFASTFPATNVIGTDLSLIQPPNAPPNCRFEIADAEDKWSFSTPFDYIHGRAFASCFKDHVPVFKSAFDALRPGGYFEMQDAAIPFRSIDESIKGTAFERWQHLIKEGTHALGRDFEKVPRYNSYFERVGFVDIVEK
ncbi:S-adenosyl-L-methionine-dependent methyltransferase [Hyaloscypha variabilis F]|uniref:S-adenosyl-L-methionine-dependent methyltransferase n=1 Tax=Hyaloscypha variabilis (strain UAMH 11265 / GT02V1 / F) TaxID=1149755 RepID=A0A2J6S6R5_HYAVF|nr:S-adenosyl-L-methionine-dependent methyltransferase [Hyaloscypha variabilis F]